MKSREQALAEIHRTGQTVCGWARKHGFNQTLVRAVLYGRIKGKWGESHKIAVLLGIKDGVIVEDEDHEHA